MKIAYVTDSGTGFSIDEMAKEQIFSLPLQISVNGKNYFDLEQISVGDVINYLKEDAAMATSQPAIGLIENLFDKLKSEGFDKVIGQPRFPIVEERDSSQFRKFHITFQPVIFDSIQWA